jgi:hypothetical protein
VTALPPSSELIPVVSDADALSDQQFFAEHTDRLYRLPPGWAIRSRGRRVLLPTPLAVPAPHPDSDTEAAAERAWWDAAYPYLPPQARAAIARAARKAGRPKPHGPLGRGAPAARGPP